MNPSYAYMYDDFLADRKFERDIASLETTLSTLDISGRIGRLSLFRSAKDLVESMVKQGAKTIVIVGNDATLDKTMWFLPDMDAIIGYLPLGPSAVAELLGIPSGTAACEVLSARRIETLDMGKLDDRYFLTEVGLPVTTAALEIEGQYHVSPAEGGAIWIRNLGGRLDKTLVVADAKDGLLEAIVQPAQEKHSHSILRRVSDPLGTRVLFKNGKIVSSQPVEVWVDNHAISNFQFTVSIVPNKLRIITGRSRKMVSAGV